MSNHSGRLEKVRSMESNVFTNIMKQKSIKELIPYLYDREKYERKEVQAAALELEERIDAARESTSRLSQEQEDAQRILMAYKELAALEEDTLQVYQEAVEEGRIEAPYVDEYASIWQRVLARIIDSVILGIISIPFFMFLYDSPENFLLVSPIMGLISILYFIPFVLYAKGQTLGKSFAKIKVLQNDDTPLTTKGAVLREAHYIAQWLVSVILAATLYQLILPEAFDTATFIEKSSILSTGLNNYPMISALNTVVSIYILVDVFIFIFHKKHCGLHDLVARTVVVKE
ncbi:MAG: RDD family protein [Reichenbachiella sp.]